MQTGRHERIYETILIAPPTAGESDLESLIGDVQDTFQARGSEIQHVERWGKKRLAYPIERHGEGFYFLFQTKGSGEAVQEVERRLRLTENCLRYLTVRLDNVAGALEAGEKRRVRRAKEEEERATRAAERAAAEAERAAAEAAKAAAAEKEAEADEAAEPPADEQSEQGAEAATKAEATTADEPDTTPTDPSATDA